MYISDDNYEQAIANLEDCMFALKSMDSQMGNKGYATKEDLEYVQPRFTEALRYILALSKHPTHSEAFKLYIKGQTENGCKVYEALGNRLPFGNFTDHIGWFLSNLVQIPKFDRYGNFKRES